jgi:hypothetical protein
MKNMLSIGYLTCRKNPCWQWFLDSLVAQSGWHPFDTEVLICDFWMQEIPHLNWTLADVYSRKKEFTAIINKYMKILVFPPKPTVWSGPFRLTRNDYFSASNSRNTIIAHASGTHLAIVDDLSVLMPGWLSAFMQSIEQRYIVCGAFRKVKELEVENGTVKSFVDHPSGHDSRWKSGREDKAVDCPGNWLFGCSLGAPVDAFLKINGFFEMCDSTGIGLDDCSCGMALANTGHKLKYDRRMLTLESEERHHLEKPMLRMDKNRGKVIEVRPGLTHPDEKGHALVKLFQNAKWFPNDFGPFPDLAALRKHVLAGGAFPVVNRPVTDFYDGQPLSEL